MATHIVLVNFTEKGLNNIQQSPDRAVAFADTAKGMGVDVEAIYWTSGGYDGVMLMNAPDEATASAAVLTLGRGGFVHTQMLRAFDRSQMESVLAKL